MSYIATLYVSTIDSPIGEIGLAVDERGRVVRIEFLGRDPEGIAEHWDDVRDALRREGRVVEDAERTAVVAGQLREYFAGRRRSFELVLAPRGSEFQRRVWGLLQQIPCGETRSYGEIAAMLGRPGASRAVGRANATNPIPIVIPCHRVIGSNGSLTGFGGGVDVKKRLLELEAADPHPQTPSP